MPNPSWRDFLKAAFTSPNDPFAGSVCAGSLSSGASSTIAVTLVRVDQQGGCPEAERALDRARQKARA